MDNFLFFRRAKREATSAQPPQQNTGGDYAENIVTVSSAEAALRIAAFHRAVELRAKTMSQLVIEYQKRSSRGNFVLDNYGPSARLNYLRG